MIYTYSILVTLPSAHVDNAIVDIKIKPNINFNVFFSNYGTLTNGQPRAHSSAELLDWGLPRLFSFPEPRIVLGSFRTGAGGLLLTSPGEKPSSVLCIWMIALQHTEIVVRHWLCA